MRSTLTETGLRGLASRFLSARKLRAFLTTLGVAFGVALIASLSILGATMQASVAEQLRQGFGTYDLMAGYHGKLMQPGEQTELLETTGVRYGVGILWLATRSREMDGVRSDFNYIAIGEFPKGEFAYPLAQGRYPGPGEFVTDPRLAEHLELKVGDTLTLNFRSGPQTVRLSGITRSGGKESSDSLLFNLTWLQEQMGLGRQVTLMVFGIQKGAKKDWVGTEMTRLNPALDVELRTELDQVVANLGGLKPMAIAFGIAGLFASIFLVAGSFNIAVQERSRELALLRAVGATQKQVMRLVVQEALLLGSLGALLGLLLGWGGALVAMEATAASIGLPAETLTVPWLSLVIIGAAGAALAVVAAWRPARAAGAIAPLAAMRPDLQQQAREEKLGGIGGLVLIGLSAVMLLAAPGLRAGSGLRALAGALGGLLCVAGLIMAQPRILPWLVGALARPLQLLYPAETVLAGRSVLRHRKRSALTAATLILGVMLTSSVVTVFSEIAVNHMAYVRSQYPAELMVTTRYDQHLGSALTSRLTAIDGVTGVASHALIHGGVLQDNRTGVTVIPIDVVAMSRLYSFGRVQGDLSAPGFVISEQWARERGVRLGDTLAYQPDASIGEQTGGLVNRETRSYPVTAIVQHWPFHAREIAASRSLYPALPDTRVMFAADPARRDEVKAAVRALLREQGLTTATIRDLSVELEEGRQMIRQRWAILGAVVAVIFVISAFGLVNAVITGLHQRRREMATIRAVGSTPAQTLRQVLLEAALLGTAGSLLGLVAGAAFTGGVTIGLAEPINNGYPVALYLGCLAAGPVLAALAAILPGLNVARGSVSRALQVE